MVCSLRAFPSREKDCRASHENGKRELPARAGGDRQWAHRRQKVTRVVIPMMIFVHATPQERAEVLTLSSVSRYMVLRGEHTPAVIPDLQMERFKFMLDYSEEAVEMCSTPLAPGEMVRVIKALWREWKESW